MSDERHIINKLIDSLDKDEHEKAELYATITKHNLILNQLLGQKGLDINMITENLFFNPLASLVLLHGVPKEEVFDRIEEMFDIYLDHRGNFDQLNERLQAKEKEIRALYEEYGFVGGTQSEG